MSEELHTHGHTDTQTHTHTHAHTHLGCSVAPSDCDVVQPSVSTSVLSTHVDRSNGEKRASGGRREGEGKDEEGVWGKDTRVQGKQTAKRKIWKDWK